jgi:hypothetical protein
VERTTLLTVIRCTWTQMALTHFSHDSTADATIKISVTVDSEEFFGETHHTADQMSGDTTNTTYFSGVQKLYNGTWYNVNAPGNMAHQGCGACTNNNGPTNEFSIWDTRYSSD